MRAVGDIEHRSAVDGGAEPCAFLQPVEAIPAVELPVAVLHLETERAIPRVFHQPMGHQVVAGVAHLAVELPMVVAHVLAEDRGHGAVHAQRIVLEEILALHPRGLGHEQRQAAMRVELEVEADVQVAFKTLARPKIHPRHVLGGVELVDRADTSERG